MNYCIIVLNYVKLITMSSYINDYIYSTDHQVAAPAATNRQHQGKTKGRLPYPRPSWLTRAEQKLYLELYDKYMSYVPTKASATEVKEINQLKVHAP